MGRAAAQKKATTRRRKRAWRVVVIRRAMVWNWVVRTRSVVEFCASFSWRRSRWMISSSQRSGRSNSSSWVPSVAARRATLDCPATTARVSSRRATTCPAVALAQVGVPRESQRRLPVSGSTKVVVPRPTAKRTFFSFFLLLSEEGFFALFFLLLLLVPWKKKTEAASTRASTSRTASPSTARRLTRPKWAPLESTTTGAAANVGLLEREDRCRRWRASSWSTVASWQREISKACLVDGGRPRTPTAAQGGSSRPSRRRGAGVDESTAATTRDPSTTTARGGRSVSKTPSAPNDATPRRVRTTTPREDDAFVPSFPNTLTTAGAPVHGGTSTTSTTLLIIGSTLSSSWGVAAQNRGSAVQPFVALGCGPAVAASARNPDPTSVVLLLRCVQRVVPVSKERAATCVESPPAKTTTRVPSSPPTSTAAEDATTLSRTRGVARQSGRSFSKQVATPSASSTRTRPRAAATARTRPTSRLSFRVPVR
mmetsp:Transcript_27375/g.88416  ORF Transcript_27375/g.88416 Transcript_27375/m.88416 type:complete len:483 (+) Transcript_27375:1308-2756(+)